MFLYLALFLLFLLSSFLEIISNNKKYSIYTFTSLILLTYILSFIRWKTGTDWDSYYEMYTWIDKPWNNFNNGMESGYNFVNHLGKFLFNSYTGVLFLFSTIIYTCTGRTYITLSKYPITSLFFSFCILSFAHIMYVRQNVAVAITGWSVYYIIILLFLHFIFCTYHVCKAKCSSSNYWMVCILHHNSKKMEIYYMCINRFFIS